MRKRWIVAIAIMLWAVAMLTRLLNRHMHALDHIATIAWSGFLTGCTCWAILRLAGGQARPGKAGLGDGLTADPAQPAREVLFQKATYLQGRVDERLATRDDGVQR